MTKQEQIQFYLRDISHGTIKITDQQAADILRIATAPPGVPGTAFCKLFRWSELREAFEYWLSVDTTKELIELRLQEAIRKQPVERQYMWECFTSQGLAGKIYTVNPCLF